MVFRMLGRMQFQHRILQVDDFLLDAIQRCSVFRFHDQPCAFLDRSHDFLCIRDHISDRGRVGVLQRVFVHMVTVTLRSAIADPVGAAPKPENLISGGIWSLDFPIFCK